MTQRRIPTVGANILVLGLAFKENCPDLRNTRVVDVIAEFQSYHADVDVHDPWVSAAEARREYGLDLVDTLVPGKYDAIVLAVAHRQFADLGADAIRALGKPDCVLFDVKQALPRDKVDDRL
jgi:UDP-N-acetyl-D-galactosamine dehydrogenase